MLGTHALRRLAQAAIVAAGCLAASAWAQQPVRMIVGYAAGGGVDTLARIVAQRIQPGLGGQSVVVDNRPGAGGVIAANAAVAAAPDGQTLFFADSALLTAPHIYRNVAFSPQKSFAPVGMVAHVHLAIATANPVAATTARELIELARRSPGKLSYGTPGVGTLHHLGMELLKSTAGVDIVHVPYKGGAPVINDLAAGQLPVGVASIPPALAQAKAGRIRLIATFSESRLQTLPDVPAIGETLPGASVVPSVFVLAPAGTPAAALARFNKALRAVLEDRATVEAFDAQGAMPAPGTPEQLGTWMRAEEDRWAGVIRKASISVE